jgi:DNA polymerase III alpha subunit
MGNIKSIKYIGECQTYDLEVNHKDHQFYLENGILTSNSHATLYSMISYQTAFLKANYPIQFLLANLMSEVNSNNPKAAGNIQQIKKEIRNHKVNILKPDINKSTLHYKLYNDELITGLDALKFVSDEAINDIIEKRPFANFFDFMLRIDSKKVRSNTIQALASCGCLDLFGIPRKLMFLYCSDYRKKLNVWLKKHDPNTDQFIFPWPKESDWTKAEIYALEQFYLGESFSCRPEDAYNTFFKDDHQLVSDVKKAKDKTNIQSIKGIVKEMFEFKVKKETSKYYGMPMIKAVMEDKKGDQCSFTIYPDRWKLIQDKLSSIKGKVKFEPGVALHFSGNVNNYEGDVGIILDKIYNFALVPAKPEDLKAKKISLKKENKLIIDVNQSQESLFEEIEDEMINDGSLDWDEDFDNFDDR